MKKTKHLIFLILLVAGIFMSSCEKDLELEIQEKGGNLVLFSFLSPDSVFSVHLSKSISHFSVDDFERVYDGNIVVLKNGTGVDFFTFPFDKTWACRDDIAITEGDSIVIRAADAEGKEVSAQTVVPGAVSVTLSDTSTVTVGEANGIVREFFECRLDIADPGDERNYYQLLVFEDICGISENDTTCERNRIDYPKTDPVFYVRDQESSLIGSLDFGGSFSDHQFNGEEYTLSLQLPLEYREAPNNPALRRKLQFVLLSHTQAYYDYYRSRVVAEYGYDLPIIDPVRIYSNVEGGLGLVSAYSASKDSLVFE